MADIPGLTAAQQQKITDLATNGIQFDLLGLPYKTPINFTGTTTVTPLQGNVTIQGQAQISQPFNVTVDGVAVSLSASGDVMLKFAPSLSIADLVQNEVQSKVSSSSWSIINTVLMPYLRLYTSPALIISIADGSDDQLGSYIKGFNVFGTLNPAQVEPLKTLAATFDKTTPVLNLSSKQVILHVGAKPGSTVDFVVEGSIPMNIPLGTKAIMLGSLGLSTTKQTDEIVVNGTCSLLFNVGHGTTLTFDGGITAQSGGSAGFFASLDSNNGVWQDPFGLKGVKIGGLGLQITAAPEFPWVGIGMRGSVDIGGALPDATLAFLFDPSQLENFIVQIASDKGLDLPRMLKALISPTAPSSTTSVSSSNLFKNPAALVQQTQKSAAWTAMFSLLNVSITNINFYMSPSGGVIAGKSYDAGMAVSGKLNLWGYKASVDGKIDYTNGGYLTGAMDAIKLQAAGMTFFALTSADGNSNPSLDIQFNKDKQGANVSGKLSLLNGLYSQSALIQISSTGFTFDVSKQGGFGIYGGARIVIDQNTGFSLTATPTVGFSTTIAGQSITLQALTTITAQINKTNAFSQTIAASVNAFGATKSLGPVGYSLPVKDVTDAANVVKQFFENDFKNFFTQTVVQAGAAAWQWVKSSVTSDAQAAERFFENAGADSSKIARGLVDQFGKSPQDAVRMINKLNNNTTEMAKVLKNEFGYSADQVTSFFKSTYNMSEDGIKSALNGAGYAADQVSSALKSAFNTVTQTLSNPNTWNPSKW